MAVSKAEAVIKTTSAAAAECDSSAIIEMYKDHAETTINAELKEVAQQQSKTNTTMAATEQIQQVPNSPTTMLQTEGRPRVIFILLLLHRYLKYVQRSLSRRQRHHFLPSK